VLPVLTAYHAKYFAYELTRCHDADGVDRLSQSLFDASVDLNPHQIDAALFALRNPIQQGVLLADEVGLERRQRRQRQDIFAVEDEIIERRDQLIDQLEKRIQQHTETDTLFTLRFKVI
jgi:hypothetical protein